MSWFYQLARRVNRALGPTSPVSKVLMPVVEPLVRLATGKRGLAWSINGIPCRIDPRFRAQLAHNYDEHLATFLKTEVRPGHTCFDVGANVGAWVIQFGHLVGPTGTVVAFEPNPNTLVILEKHVRLNQLDRVVRVVPVAVGAAAGELSFSASGSDGMSRLGEPNPALSAASQTILVPVVTLDEWTAANGVRPDWLFIDVEGYEGFALAGASRLIRESGPRLGIVVEMHPSLWPSSGTDAGEMRDRVAALGRRAVPLTGQADVYAEYGHVVLEPI